MDHPNDAVDNREGTLINSLSFYYAKYFTEAAKLGSSTQIGCDNKIRLMMMAHLRIKNKKFES